MTQRVAENRARLTPADTFTMHRAADGIGEGDWGSSDLEEGDESVCDRK
jgi:hypothetical protein